MPASRFSEMRLRGAQFILPWIQLQAVCDAAFLPSRAVRVDQPRGRRRRTDCPSAPGTSSDPQLDGRSFSVTPYRRFFVVDDVSGLRDDPLFDDCCFRSILAPQCRPFFSVGLGSNRSPTTAPASGCSPNDGNENVTSSLLRALKRRPSTITPPPF